jgi:hypothetical protein
MEAAGIEPACVPAASDPRREDATRAQDPGTGATVAS